MDGMAWQCMTVRQHSQLMIQLILFQRIRIKAPVTSALSQTFQEFFNVRAHLPFRAGLLLLCHFQCFHVFAPAFGIPSQQRAATSQAAHSTACSMLEDSEVKKHGIRPLLWLTQLLAREQQPAALPADFLLHAHQAQARSLQQVTIHRASTSDHNPGTSVCWEKDLCVASATRLSPTL